jgi:hypothetical protein
VRIRAAQLGHCICIFCRESIVNFLPPVVKSSSVASRSFEKHTSTVKLTIASSSPLLKVRLWLVAGTLDARPSTLDCR